MVDEPEAAPSVLDAVASLQTYSTVLSAFTSAWHSFHSDATSIDSVLASLLAGFSQLELLCAGMDGPGLRAYLIERRDELRDPGRALDAALLVAPDPGLLVLAAATGFCRAPPAQGETDGDAKVSCRLLIDLLDRIRALGMKPSPEAREEARAVAADWKGSNRIETQAVFKNETIGFLLLVGVFGLVEDVGGADGVLDLVVSVSSRERAVEVFLGLGLDLDKHMPGVRNVITYQLGGLFCFVLKSAPRSLQVQGFLFLRLPVPRCHHHPSNTKRRMLAGKRAATPPRTMATATEPEDAAPPPSAAKGAKVGVKRKQSHAQGGGGGGRGGGGRGEGGGGDECRGKKRKGKEVPIYGNYRNYYGYRIDRNVCEDPRLEIFKREWFEGKDCLDIGCNQGLVTIGLAMKFECRSILGVDIDSGLIETANWNLRSISREVARKSAKVPTVSPDFSASCSEVASEISSWNISNHKHHDIFETVSFRRENFVESMHGCSEQYDTILCLSVTKWIHLNWGDDGIITLFVKIWRLLRPGGIFIMEPQPWTSYRKNRLVSEVAKANFSEICIGPEGFREILLDKVGFRSAEVVTDRLVGSVTGFDRPIEVYHK